MGFWERFRRGRGGRFHSESDHAQNRDRQLAMMPQTLDVLREHGVAESDALRLEYFFYTDSAAKARDLSSALGRLSYAPEVQESEGGLFLVTGWSPPQRMALDSLAVWVEEMCLAGFESDAEFDGWGTNPDQE